MSESEELLSELKKQTQAIEALNQTMIKFSATLSFNMGAILGMIDKQYANSSHDEDDGLSPSNQYLDGSDVKT